MQNSVRGLSRFWLARWSCTGYWTIWRPMEAVTTVHMRGPFVAGVRWLGSRREAARWARLAGESAASSVGHGQAPGLDRILLGIGSLVPCEWNLVRPFARCVSPLLITHRGGADHSILLAQERCDASVAPEGAQPNPQVCYRVGELCLTSPPSSSQRRTPRASRCPTSTRSAQRRVRDAVPPVTRRPSR